MDGGDRLNWTAEDYLEHHGIKGMKWGVRRYQNPDGTLTELGKKKYGSAKKFQEAREVKKSKRSRALLVGAGLAAGAAGVSAGIKSGKLNKNSIVDTGSKLNDPTIKGGKDKAPMSPAERITRETGKSIDNVGRLMDSAQRKKELDRANEPIKLSDDELRKRINRLNMEKQYRDLLRSSSVDIGYERVKENINMTASLVGIAASVAGIAATVHTLRKK